MRFLRKTLDVYQGRYVNAYGDAWQVKSYHSDCYRESIIREYRLESVPHHNGIKEWPGLEKYFMTLKNGHTWACKLCGMILWDSDTPLSHLKLFKLEHGSRFPEKIVRLHQEAYDKHEKVHEREKEDTDIFDFDRKECPIPARIGQKTGGSTR